MYSGKGIELYICLLLVILVRCLEKSILLSKIVPSTFSSLLFLIDTSLLESSTLAPNNIRSI